MQNIIREYLVSVGYKTDKEGEKQVKASAQRVEKTVKNLATAVKVLATASGVQKLGKYFADVARQDLEFEKLARQMWTTKENAEALNRTLGVMGVSLQDLWLSPELREQFVQLRGEALEMQAPDELQNQLREVRAILFEVSRFRLTLQYLGKWVTYFFLQYMQQPLDRLKKAIRGDNETLKKEMPETANKLGMAATALFRLVLAGLELMHRGWEAIPKEAVAGILAIGAAAKLVGMGPVGRMIAALMLLLALYEDYRTWQGGGISLVEWERFGDNIERIRGSWERFTGDASWQSMRQGIGELVQGANELFEALGGWDTVAGLFEGFLETVNWLVDSVGKLAGFLGEVFGWLADIAELYQRFADKLTANMPAGGASANFLMGTDLGGISAIVNPVAPAGRGNTNQTQQNTFNIYTQDPATAGQSVADTMDGLSPWFDGSIVPAY